jgi:predicted dehydrogenase
MKKVRVALIGAGKIAGNQHLPGLLRLDSVEFVTLCDLSTEVLQTVTSKFNLKCNLETDYHNVLRDHSIEAVIITTKEELHVPLTLEALAAGKHVYVEKPLAENPEDCHKVVDLVKATGKIVAVGLNRRMAPAYRKAKELLLASGGARNMFYRIADSYAIGWGKEYPGQRMFHELCHVFDILRFFTNSEPTSIYCISGRHDDETLVLNFASGATASILSSGYARQSLPKEHFEAIAERGALTVEEFVTLRQFNLSATEPSTINFSGHTHLNFDQGHSELFREIGDEALIAMRRNVVTHIDVCSRLEENSQTDSSDYRFRKNQLARCFDINYLVDKGWYAALESFIDAIRMGKNYEGANAVDGYIASAITRAAYKSLKYKKVIDLNF